MVEILTLNDMRSFFSKIAAAIELDQIRADALPSRTLHQEGAADMWRGWRNDHLRYLDALVATVDNVTTAELEKLTWVAVSCEPRVVRDAVRETLADAAGGICPWEDLATAKLFFNRVIEAVSGKDSCALRRQSAVSSMKRWLSSTDPLLISKDPESGYELPPAALH